MKVLINKATSIWKCVNCLRDISEYDYRLIIGKEHLCDKCLQIKCGELISLRLKEINYEN